MQECSYLSIMWYPSPSLVCSLWCHCDPHEELHTSAFRLKFKSTCFIFCILGLFCIHTAATLCMPTKNWIKGVSCMCTLLLFVPRRLNSSLQHCLVMHLATPAFESFLAQLRSHDQRWQRCLFNISLVFLLL